MRLVPALDAEGLHQRADARRPGRRARAATCSIRRRTRGLPPEVPRAPRAGARIRPHSASAGDAAGRAIRSARAAAPASARECRRSTGKSTRQERQPVPARRVPQDGQASNSASAAAKTHARIMPHPRRGGDRALPPTIICGCREQTRQRADFADRSKRPDAVSTSCTARSRSAAASGLRRACLLALLRLPGGAGLLRRWHARRGA